MSNYNVVAYDSSVINYCSIEDVPIEINYSITPVENEGQLTGTSLNDIHKIFSSISDYIR